MPLTKVHILKGFSAEYRRKLGDLIHSSLVDAFRIPVSDRTQLFFEFEKVNWEIPAGRSEQYTYIEVHLFTGRSAGAKKEFYRLVAERFKTELGNDPLDVFILLVESPIENWGIRGGKPAGEVDLGFKIDV